MLLSGPQLINMLASFVSSRLQAINFQLVFNQGSQPLDAYNSFPFRSPLDEHRQPPLPSSLDSQQVTGSQSLHNAP